MQYTQNLFLLQTGMVENLIKLAQAGLTDRDKGGEKMDLTGHLSSSTQVTRSVVLYCTLNTKSVSGVPDVRNQLEDQRGEHHQHLLRAPGL